VPVLQRNKRTTGGSIVGSRTCTVGGVALASGEALIRRSTTGGEHLRGMRDMNVREHLSLRWRVIVGVALFALCGVGVQLAGAQTNGVAASVSAALAGGAETASALPGDYVIGPEDQLSVMFFQNKD